MRSVVIDALSGRQLLAGEEERDATQPFVFYLTQRLGWDPNQIMTRPQWRVPKSPSAPRTSGYPIDVAVFDSPSHCGDPAHVRILVECKAPDEEEGITQLKTYLTLEPEARLGIWFNGRSHCLVYKLADGFAVNKYAPVPRPTDPLAPTAAEQPLKYGDLVQPPNLGETFWRLRDHIAAQDTHVNRDEFILNDLANLLICKIADEQEGELEPERPLAFQLAGSPAATAVVIRRFFDEVKTRLSSVFTDESDRLHIDDSSLDTVVRTLQPYRLLGHDRHAVGTAFQILRGRALKGEEGAYFTPPPLVDCVVSILGPDHKCRVLDPACGTGGFLAATLDAVFEAIDAKKVSRDVKANAKHQWAQDSLFAVDKDIVSTKLCKAYLTLLGDGRSHVYRANTIDRSDWNKRSDDLTRVVTAGGFDLILTNPPFGKNLKVSAEVGLQEGLITCRRWRREGNEWISTDVPIDQQIGLVFFERDLELLKPGGRLAIVLPETFLFSKSFRWFIDWICRTLTVTHVVDVPMVAFEEYCRAKTCLLFVTKKAPPRGHQIVASYPRSIGLDKYGNPQHKMGDGGERNGELDNEMADAVRLIVGSEYRGAASGAAKRAAASEAPTRLCFRVSQEAARDRGVLVPRFWWREDSDRALENWMAEHPSKILTLGQLADDGILKAFEGHGSPPGNARATGDVPYVKVTDLKNWRINENPTNFIHKNVADKLRKRGPALRYGDLVTPARASSNIGQFSLVLPWQTHVVLTKEVLVLRVLENDRGVTPFLLLALMSLQVVQDQYKTLALMQTNREHLGDAWRDVRIPMPTTAERMREIGEPVAHYFSAIVEARRSLNGLEKVINPRAFGTRP